MRACNKQNIRMSLQNTVVRIQRREYNVRSAAGHFIKQLNLREDGVDSTFATIDIPGMSE
jgi:hypothetical protein